MSTGHSACVALTLAAAISLSAEQTPPPRAPAAPVPATGAERLQLPARDAPSQAQAVGTGVIRGRVTRTDNGEPLRRVQIRLTATGVRDLPSTMTDDSGRFDLTALPAARYTLTASKAGFVTLEYGQRRPNEAGRPIDLAAGATVESVDVGLPRGAAVAGRVVDDDGEGVPNALVQLLRRRYVNGTRRLSAGVGTSDRTDDQGQFRVYGAPPGTYYLVAIVPLITADPRIAAISESSSTPTFYPGTASAEQAQAVVLSLGQEIAGLTLTAVQARVATISGVVRGSDGQPLTEGSVSLGQTMAFSSGSSSRGGSIRLDGSFAFPDLAPGAYTVSVRPPQGTGRDNESATVRVTLDGADAKIALTLRRANMVRGRIRFEGGVPTSSRLEFSVRAVSVDPVEAGASLGSASLGMPREDWTFESAVTAGMRLLRMNPPAGWVMKSVRSGNADITDTPIEFGSGDIEGIEVVVTNRLTEVTGVVRDRRGQITSDATVVLFVDDPSKWGLETRFVATARLDQNGRFRHRGLPPARYVAVALEYLEPGEETSREMLDRLLGLGTRVTLSEGETTAVDLTLGNP